MLYTFSSALYEQMEAALDLIQGEVKKEKEKYADAMNCIQQHVQQLETFVLEHGFDSADQEMDFFKSIYPRFYCWFIYYSELFSIHKLLPVNGTELMLRDYYLGEYQYQHRFFAQNRALYDYYLESEFDRDEHYFLRKNYQPGFPASRDQVPDQHFMTNEGYTFCKFMAFERLQEYVGRKLRLLYRNPESEYVQALLKDSKRKWTGDKIELIEIAYGIYYTRRMNGGKVEVRDIIEWLEDSLGIDLGDGYRMFADLKRRKGSSYTKFLEEMISAIQGHIQDKQRFKAAERKIKF